MYLIGIDISKFKHDCFIATETDEVIKESLMTSPASVAMKQSCLNLEISIPIKYIDLSLLWVIKCCVLGYTTVSIYRSLARNETSKRYLTDYRLVIKTVVRVSFNSLAVKKQELIHSTL